MSDFGADIFDTPPPPPPRRPAEPAPAAEAADPPAGKRPRRPRKPKVLPTEPEGAPAPAGASAPEPAAAEPAAPVKAKARRPRKTARPADEPATDPVPAPTDARTEPPSAAAEVSAPPAAPMAETPPPAAEPVEPTEPVEPVTSPEPDAGPARPPRPRFADGAHRAFVQRPRPPRQERQDLAPPQPRATPTEPPRRPTVRRLGVLLDLVALQDEARQRGAELSFRKLLPALAGGARVTGAICYLPTDAPTVVNSSVKAIGFRAKVVDSVVTIGEHMAADAAAMLPHLDALVLAPGGAAQLDLAARLRADGATVEVAGFVPNADEQALRLLGRECVFVP